jgi:hypothetical protein
MFTAIPTGIVSANASTGVTVASLSVYVTPQITDGSLASVPAFLDWPSTVAALTFSVQFRGTAASDPRATATLDPNPKYAANRFDSALWKAICGPQAPVQPWTVKDFRASGLLSFKSKDVSAAVKTTYKSVAAQESKPVITRGGADLLSKRTADIAAVLPHGPAIGARVKSSIGSTTPALSGQAMSVVPVTTFVDTPEFARAAAHHNRDNYRNIVPTSGPTQVPVPDFHQIIGHLADHPVILRRVGLIIDLVFTVPVGQSLDGFTNIFVEPTTPIPGVQVNHPWTYCKIHPAGSGSVPTFRPVYGDVDKPPGYPTRPVVALVDTNGLVQVGNKNVVHVDDLDIDHASVHLSHYAEKATKDLSTSVAAGGPASLPVALPALRTVGLAVHHVDRETHVGLRFQDTMSWNPNGATFVAENLVRGYRVDVRQDTGPWQSLCLRNTTFTFANGAAPITVPGDEGYVKATAMSTANGEPLHNVSESLFHWDGWSLVASRPGLSVGPTSAANGAPAEGPVDPLSTGATLNMPYASKVVSQPGSLMKLRFGRSYQFRVRAVDLCGNDMRSAASDNTTEHASPVKKFVRYEPVSPPVLQIRRPVTEGESLEHLVIRSDPYAPTPLNAQAWAAKNNVAPPGAPPAAPATMGMGLYYATCERHVAPPKTSVQLAEYHGAVDAAVASVPAGQARANAAWAIVSKEDGSFNDRHVTDSTTGQYRTYGQPGRSIVTPAFSMPEVAKAIASGLPAFTGDQEITPRGTALQPGQYVVFDTDTVMLPYLPDANATGLAVQGLSSTPLFRTYGARATNPSGGAWPELSTFRIVLNESASGITFSGLSASLSAASGATTISLPPATLVDITYSSTVSDPIAHAFGPASTSDAMFASAQKGLLPTLSPPRTLTVVHAVQRPKAPALFNGDVSVLPRAEGETVQTVQANLRFDGPSSGRVDLVASWVEYVDTGVGSVDPSTNPIPHTGSIHTITPNVTDSTSFQSVRQLFGDTKRRDITFSSVATTRFREYFPPSITSNSANITTSATLPSPIICRSSARPPIPRVLYAVPSFAFSASGSGTTTTRTRAGGIVRVYVDRGWFASGADERLGVVLAQNPGDAAKIPNLVSVWGQDPIWYRKGLGALDTSHINTANVAEIAFGVPLAEGAGTVNVATYRPTFNAERGLWYFDIAINADKAYFPFLRLALVRYQPQSIGTLHMSPVVCTEFVQLSADRTASVVDAGAGKYSVSLSGPTSPNVKSLPGSGAAEWASGHFVTAEFQQATTDNPDPMDWAILGTATTLPPSSVTDGNVTFQATVTFPTASSIAGSKHRILFREYEVYAADAEDGVREGVGVVQVGAPATSYKTRIVYADAVTINI